MDTKDKSRTTSRKTPNAGHTATQSNRTKSAPRANPATRRRTQDVTQKPKKPTPEVVYIQPGPFNRNRFLLRLATVVAVVLAVVFGMSIFFKVDPDKITVSGMDKYTAWEIREASGLQGGENLLTLNDGRIGGKIQAALPYVDEVRVGIKLPDTVNIEIVELDVVYAVEADDGSWWLTRSDGGIVEKTNEATAGEHTKVLGVKITAPEVGKQAVAYEPVPDTTEEGETQPVTVLGSERLSTAVTILQYLEQHGVIGTAASVDVSDMTQLEVWYGSRFQVELGDATDLNYKIECMVLAIHDEGMGNHASGVLDVSFTTWPNEVGYTPFP